MLKTDYCVRRYIWIRRDPFASIEILSGARYLSLLLPRKMRNSSRYTAVLYTLKSRYVPLFTAIGIANVGREPRVSAHPLIIFRIRNSFTAPLSLSPPAPIALSHEHDLSTGEMSFPIFFPGALCAQRRMIEIARVVGCFFFFFFFFF